MKCFSICKAHVIKENQHTVDRKLCIGCGQCAEVCPSKALHVFGEEVTVEALIPRILDDKAFFDESGGGVTLSGGEPMMQFDFTCNILKALKEKHIHTALDTSGYAAWESFEKVLPYTDLVLYDLKAIDEKTHISCTGVSNTVILSNLRKIDQYGKTIDVRIPFVPGFNSDQIGLAADFLKTFHHVRSVKVLPYHAFAETKYSVIGRAEDFLKINVPSSEDIMHAVDTLRAAGINATDQTGEY